MYQKLYSAIKVQGTIANSVIKRSMYKLTQAIKVQSTEANSGYKRSYGTKIAKLAHKSIKVSSYTSGKIVQGNSTQIIAS
ncbi:hypothetical protein HYD44_03830 [Mycoplasmopsis bovis]|nr:hypothetical protein [Mycoplasmopsis bovis]QQH83848.1 hypothetical protein HYD44_03830 [Mycoplasmopsis bovis]